MVVTPDAELEQIIFIPGFYGSHLVQASDEKVVWISAAQALFGRKTAARVGFGVPGELTLVPAGILQRVPIVPGIYSRDFYGRFLKRLQREKGSRAQIHHFAYDWREDYYQTVQKLGELIESLQTQGVQRISIIAHSMGGLIASYYLRYGTQQPETAIENWQGAQVIGRVVMVTVPFAGSLIVFRNMKWGAKFGLNTSLIKADALASFASSYQIIANYVPVFLDRHLQPLNHSLLEADDWEKYQWGFLRNRTNLSEEVMQHRRQFVRKALARANVLNKRINEPSQNEGEVPTKLLYIYATSHSTLAKAILLTGEDQQPTRVLFDKKEFKQHMPNVPHSILFADGDSAVTTKAARLPEAFRLNFSTFVEQKSNSIHSAVFRDKAVQERIMVFLR